MFPQNGEIAQDILGEFEELWNSPTTQDYSDFIEEYTQNYLREKMIRKQRKAAMKEQIIELGR